MQMQVKGQKKENISGVYAKCTVGFKQAEVDLLNLLHLHENEIFEILPKNVVGIGTTFERSYKEPSIVLYINKSLELSDEIIRILFKILKRPPEDVIICQLSTENESDENAGNNNNKNTIDDGYNDYLENENIVDKNGSEDDRENGSSTNKKYESNRDEDDHIENRQDDNKKRNKKESNENNKDNGKEDGGDGGDEPNGTNGVNLDGFIKASASVNIMFEEIIQKATMQFILQMKHPNNKNDRLDIAVTKISISGGRMLSNQSKSIKVIGYYPIEVQVSFTAISKLLEDKDSNLINFVNESIPIRNISTQTHTKTVKKGVAAGFEGYTPNAIVNYGQEEIISEENIPIVTITTVESGGTRFLWEHALNNKKRKIPGYSAPTHKADFEYEKVLVKEFEIKMELVLASEFKSRFSISRVNKLPEKLRFSLSIIIKEDKIQEIFKENSETKCTHREPLMANKENGFKVNSAPKNFPGKDGIIYSQEIENHNE
ncbi:3594_t:CDS:2 [Acaulospora morrowiae]|uniref:3594_t:CDS:1 n=1 Tax=Acaulospora morrowiae TaxID=94023 RepID=A0A9N9CF19_9GLOM|nr:3594_t:CDS:2 [Acaulospora morrowiae]